MNRPTNILEDALEALDANLDAPRRDAQKRRLRAAIPVRRASILAWSGFAAAATAAVLAGFVLLEGTPGVESKVAVSTPVVAVAPVRGIARQPSEQEPAKPPSEDALPGTPSLRHVSLGRGVVMALGEHAKARGRRVGPRRYQVQLEEGMVELGDQPMPTRTVTRAAWVVLAGEYRVNAQDAVFSVSYEAASRAVHVQVSKGQVLVSGPYAPPQKISAGQELHASKTLRSASNRKQAQRDPAAPSPESQDWHALYQAGRYGDALTLARRSGLTASLGAGLSAGDLTDLAHAARLARASSEAQTLLQALRTRYPDARGARDAAFLLGRLASDRGSAAEAQSWFTTYLRESPSGAYAQESLGRLLTLASQGSDSARARDLANRYLSKFPGGPYAVLARTLTH